ncbi:MAG: flippase-like domain-containing protein [Parafilimonas sp.]|nr:flippase-like domain-containing protein [Parafilimonas sp.]
MQKQVINSRLKILLNYVLGPLLFIVLIYIIYLKVKAQPDLPQEITLLKSAFSQQHIWQFALLFLLLFLNWGIEARKWQILMKPIQKVSFLTSVKAILSGLALSLFLPNGFGEYPARALYMNEGNRLRSVALNVAGSMAQLIVTLVAGIISLIYLKHYSWKGQENIQGLPILWLNGIISMIIMGTMLLVVIYFRLSWLTKLFEKIPFVHKYKYFIESVETFHWKELTRILYLSCIRFIVFVVQYILVLHLLEVKIDVIDAICTTCVLFLFLAILPTIPFADVGVRGIAGRQLFGLLTENDFGIVATIALVWFVNLIIPSAAGSLFLLGIKLFKKADKTNNKT